LFFTIALLANFSIIHLFLKTSVVDFFRDRPGQRKVHQRIIPRAGGICMVVSFMVLVTVWKFALPVFPVQLSDSFFFIMMFIALCVLGIGLFDDAVKFTINNKAKFLLEIVIALQIVYLFGFSIGKITLWNWNLDLGAFGPVLTVLWIVGVANATNMIDGLDGLAGTIMSVFFAMIGLFAFLGDQYEIVLFCFLLTGLTGGFLIHNKSPARIFLGDTGSLFLGTVAGILSIKLVTSSANTYQIFYLPLLIGFPLLDISVAMLRRFVRTFLNERKIKSALSAMTLADSEHIHHRFTFIGLSHSQTCVVLGVLSGTLIAGGFLASKAGVLLIFVFLYLALMIIWLLDHLIYFDRLKKWIMKKYQIKKLHNQTVHTIQVVNADEVLELALPQFGRMKYQFRFTGIESCEEVNDKELIVVNVNDTDSRAVFDKIGNLLSIESCPVVVIVDELLSRPLMDVCKEYGNLLIVKKPVYVPTFLNEIYQLINDLSSQSRKQLLNKTRHIKLACRYAYENI
jgi:UDP-GlcNAc:undecaprenyl-phosphate GlcNAc-1-phosphate transferase